MVLCLKGQFSDTVLFRVVAVAKTDNPPIGRFEALPPIGTTADVSTLNRSLVALRDNAVVASNPSSVTGA